jgi:hypothetical protein
LHFLFDLLPPLLTMTIMSTWAIVFLLEFWLVFCATFGGMSFFCLRILLPRFGIDVSSTKLLTTFPAPRLTTAGANKEIVCASGKPARKNVVTRIIFEAPPLAPGALLGIHLV